MGHPAARHADCADCIEKRRTQFVTALRQHQRELNGLPCAGVLGGGGANLTLVDSSFSTRSISAFPDGTTAVRSCEDAYFRSPL